MEVFIWTEAFNCGEILEPMLSSYIKHNPYPIHVFGTENDLQKVSIKSKLIVYKTLSNQKNYFKSVEKQILSGYKKGHLGTAVLWDHIINSRSETIFIHLDADTIFLDDVISDLVHATKVEGYSIVGSRRPYRNRPYRKNGRDASKLNARPDCVNTDCFAFNKAHVSKHPRFWLRRKILGKRVSVSPVVDFFDPVTFEIIRKGGKVKYMDSPNEGLYSNINKNSKFINSRISFAAVGSGCNFHNNGYEGVPIGYSSFALSSYSLFAREFLNKDIGIPPLNDVDIQNKLDKLDKENWTLLN
jgi:hypothetical protein